MHTLSLVGCADSIESPGVSPFLSDSQEGQVECPSTGTTGALTVYCWYHKMY